MKRTFLVCLLSVLGLGSFAQVKEGLKISLSNPLLCNRTSNSTIPASTYHNAFSPLGGISYFRSFQKNTTIFGGSLGYSMDGYTNMLNIDVATTSHRGRFHMISVEAFLGYCKNSYSFTIGAAYGYMIAGKETVVFKRPAELKGKYEFSSYQYLKHSFPILSFRLQKSLSDKFELSTEIRYFLTTFRATNPAAEIDGNFLIPSVGFIYKFNGKPMETDSK